MSDPDNPLLAQSSALVREACAFVRTSLAHAGGAGLHAITVPAPLASVESVARCMPRDMGVVWVPPDGPELAMYGAVARFEVADLAHGGALSTALDAQWRRLQSHAYAGCGDVKPRVFGGIAFSAGFRDEIWSDFGDGDFVLPQWCYRRTRDEAYLTVIVDFDASKPDIERLLSECASLLMAVDTAEEVELPADAVTPHFVERQTLQEWSAYLDEVRHAIGLGRFEKIVAARRSAVRVRESVDDAAILARLRLSYAGCTKFAFRRGATTFLGATPETLFAKHGSKVVTEALAGTSLASEFSGLTGESGRLMSSSKNLREHAFVVKEICDDLGPISERVQVAELPIVRKVNELYHLNTRISADLNIDANAFDLLRLLHPTPAVAGLPTAASASWIAEHERVPRGWYTGALGWLEPGGDSSFVVAIRCGLLCSSLLYLYAGAGIVLGSNPEDEYLETEQKQWPILGAAGLLTRRAPLAP